jgi:predicted transcriptional regulator
VCDDEEAMTLYSLADLARALGVSRQAVSDRYARGTLPEPDHRTKDQDWPMWERTTLERAGVLPKR